MGNKVPKPGDPKFEEYVASKQLKQSKGRKINDKNLSSNSPSTISSSTSTTSDNEDSKFDGQSTLGASDWDNINSNSKNDDDNLEDCNIDILERFSHVDKVPIAIDDFDLIKVLGKGSFGKVMLVRYKGNQQLYAMKTLRKEALVRRKQLMHTSTERYILQNISHPFLMHLSFAFQTREKLYMVLDYMIGGELFFWLRRGKFTESRARLYAAELTLAIETLHDHNIVYRDLKPENILLDAKGHLRITDFGLSKANITSYGPGPGGTKTFCGTPEYLAPEILENKGHGKGIDWWSLGTLLYEMICGLPPFYDKDVPKMYKKIMTQPLPSHRNLSKDALSIINGLLQRRVASRLGCGPNGAWELKNHVFFGMYNWEDVYEGKYMPDFVPPKKRRSTDVDNFDDEFTAQLAEDSVVEQELTETQEELSNFEGFTYQGDDENEHFK